MNTTRRGPNARPLSPTEAAEIVPASKLMEALERVVGETLAFRQDNTARKTDDLVFAALDTNHDGLLSEEEIMAAPAVLLALDQDDDDCITLDEFAPPAPPMLVAVGMGPPERAMPAASTLLMDGTGPLFVPRLIRLYDRNRDGKLTQEEIGLSPERFRALDTDGDGKLSAEELKAFYRQPPDLEATLELEPPAGKPQLQLMPGSNAQVTRPDVAVFGLGDTDVALGVRSFDPVKSAIDDARQQFNRLDADQNGYLDRDELKDSVRFQRGLFEAIDADGDNKIFWEEMEAYVRSRAEAAASRCDIVLYDLGHGFFEALDRNHDGRIGLREIRNAPTILKALRKPGQVGLKSIDPPSAAAPRSGSRHLPVVRYRSDGRIDCSPQRRAAASAGGADLVPADGPKPGRRRELEGVPRPSPCIRGTRYRPRWLDQSRGSRESTLGTEVSQRSEDRRKHHEDRRTKDSNLDRIERPTDGRRCRGRCADWSMHESG